MLKTIFTQETAAHARTQWNSVADALRDRAPGLAELMDEACDDVLAYTAFPREHWTRIASANPIERLNGAIKRRTDVVGIFRNAAAIVRLVGALMLEQDDEWAVSRRDMTLEGLAVFSDAPAVRLPAVAARPTRTHRGSALRHHVRGHDPRSHAALSSVAPASPVEMPGPHRQRYCHRQALSRASLNRRANPPTIIALLHHAMGHDPDVNRSSRQATCFGV